MADSKKKVETGVKPTSQVDLERRLSGDEPEPLPGADLKVEGNDTSAYVNVDPIYQNYANETEKPYAFEGTEGKAVENQGVAVEEEDKKSKESAAKPVTPKTATTK